MSTTSLDIQRHEAAVEAHFLGKLDFFQCVRLQERLVNQAIGRGDGQIDLLVCEHPPLITIGRDGSPAELQLDIGLLRDRRIEAHWVKRGGRCIVHAPGQLAVYPIIPLQWHRFSPGEYLDRFQAGLVETLAQLDLAGHTRPGRHGIWGRTGQLVAFGVAVRNGVAYHGAFINVSPPMGLFRLVDTDPAEMTRMSCLVAERRRPVRMTSIRAELVCRLADAFGCARYHLHTGHPWLARGRKVLH
jgi:lipoyl(octanoyl) transferase